MRRRGEFAVGAGVRRGDPGDGERRRGLAASDIRNDLAVAEDALGQLLIELGETRRAKDAFRRALARLEPLIVEFPTVPRFRETLARPQ